MENVLLTENRTIDARVEHPKKKLRESPRTYSFERREQKFS